MALSEGPELTVVVPAYNEAGTIEAVVGRLRELPFALQIIVVDDCSTDDTAAIASAPRGRRAASATSAIRARAPRCARPSPRRAAASS